MSTDRVNPPLSSVFATSPVSERSNSSQSDPESPAARPAATGNERSELNAYFDELQESICKIEQTLRENYQKALEATDNVRQMVENRRARSLRGDVLEGNLDLCVISLEGSLFWCWFTDGSSGQPQGASHYRYGVGDDHDNDNDDDDYNNYYENDNNDEDIK